MASNNNKKKKNEQFQKDNQCSMELCVLFMRFLDYNVHVISSNKDTWEPNSSIFIRHIRHNSIDHDIFCEIKKSI